MIEQNRDPGWFELEAVGPSPVHNIVRAEVVTSSLDKKKSLTNLKKMAPSEI